MNICPSGGDDRDFLARQERFDTLGTKDANGANANGYVYCNLGIEVKSQCEDERDVVKGWKRNGDEVMCASFDGVNSRTFKKASSCFNKAQEGIFDE